jgi:hypothetical protein
MSCWQTSCRFYSIGQVVSGQVVGGQVVGGQVVGGQVVGGQVVGGRVTVVPKITSTPDDYFVQLAETDCLLCMISELSRRPYEAMYTIPFSY